MMNDAYAEQVTPEAQRSTRLKVRCGNCGRLLAERVTAPWVIKCSRCKAINESAPLARRPQPLGEPAIKRVAAVRDGNRTAAAGTSGGEGS
jgi:phage FluMu protein Com